MITHLHTRSYYTFHQSTLSINDIVLNAKKLNYQSVCLCDLNVMYGTMEFINACKKHQIRPIIGLEIEFNYNNIIANGQLIAKNEIGLSNLYRLSTKLSDINNTISINELDEYLSDNYLIFYGVNGHLEEYLNDQEKLFDMIKSINTKYPNSYIAITTNEENYYQKFNHNIKDICNKLNHQTLALSMVYYLNKDDYKKLQVLQAVKKRIKIEDSLNTPIYHREFKDIDTLKDLYDDNDLNNTSIISNSINYDFNKLKGQLPRYDLKYDSKIYLKKLCQLGLQKRLNNKKDDRYQIRLDNELEVILKMGFEDYFLIVYDIVNFCKKNNILIGPGRGSAVSCLVSYCLGITHIDPIKYNLLFERFLNSKRKKMPDIDLDIPGNKRQECLDYLKVRYGNEYVSRIISFDRYKAKNSLGIMMEQFMVPEYKAKALSKTIKKSDNDLIEIYLHNKQFKDMIDNDKLLKKVYDNALAIKDIPSHISITGAGIVINANNLLNIIPLVKKDDIYLTQYSKDYLENVGLIKFDILSLENLEILSEINQEMNNKELYDIPLNDKKAYDVINNIEIAGIFQLGTKLSKEILKEFKVHEFKDLVALLAILRPNTKDYAKEYISNRSNPSKIKYLHPDLKVVLSETYGVILFQEQIMRIISVISGFSLAKADLLRRAFDSHDKSNLLELKEEFYQESLKKGYEKDTITDIYDNLVKHNKFGFNKSHAIAYGVLSYQLAYLKANNKSIFYKATFNAKISDKTLTKDLYKEARKYISILPLDINKSNEIYQLINQDLLTPLTMIKGVNKEIASKIINERQKEEFNDYVSFCLRMYNIGISEDIIKKLIYSGALDSFKYNRMTMIDNLKLVLDYADIVQVKKDDGFSSNYNLAKRPLIYAKKDDFIKNAKNEIETLGFYLKFSPLDYIIEKYNMNVLSFNEIKNSHSLINKGLGQVTRIKEITTKNNDKMCFIDLIDDTDTFNLAIMPNIYAKINEELKVGKYLYFESEKQVGKTDRAKNAKVMEFEES